MLRQHFRHRLRPSYLERLTHVFVNVHVSQIAPAPGAAVASASPLVSAIRAASRATHNSVFLLYENTEKASTKAPVK